MEMASCDALDFIQQRYPRGLDEDLGRELMKQVLEALVHLHAQGVIHRGMAGEGWYTVDAIKSQKLKRHRREAGECVAVCQPRWELRTSSDVQGEVEQRMAHAAFCWLFDLTFRGLLGATRCVCACQLGDFGFATACACHGKRCNSNVPRSNRPCGWARDHMGSMCYMAPEVRTGVGWHHWCTQGWKDGREPAVFCIFFRTCQRLTFGYG